ncbi:Histamine H2 receptor [Mactra antiquata]
MNITDANFTELSNNTIVEINDIQGIPVFGQVMIALQLVCMVAIVSGNTLVLTAIFKFKSLQDVTSIFVANLAVADLITGLSLPFQVSFFFYPDLETNKIACLLRFEIISFACNASILSLACTVIDRFVAISFPLRYSQIMTKKVALCLVITIWAIDMLTAFIPTFTANNFDISPFCLYELVMDKNFRCANFVSGLVFAFIMFIMYVRIYVIVRQHEIRIQNEIGNYMRHLSIRAGRQMNSIVAIVVIFFHLSWLPFFIIQLTMLNFQDVTKSKVLISNFLVFLGILNSIVNPIIYAWKNKHYRRAFKKLLGMKTVTEVIHIAVID